MKWLVIVTGSVILLGALLYRPSVGTGYIDIASNASNVVEVRISSSSDDAEEADSGGVYHTSSDLELAEDGNRGEQIIGLRFSNVSIPPSATITRAHLQFQVDESSSIATTLNVVGQAADDAATFANAAYGISSRLTTSATVAWAPPVWTVVGDAGTEQQTPDLTSIVQEIVGRPGWSHGNAMAFIISGSGKRVAESFDGLPEAAPLLHVEYTGGVTPTATNTPTPLLPGINYSFAVIGDYGDGSTDEAAVASLVASWAPDFVITLGDNNYPDGEATTIDQNAGQFYSQFIGNYQGSYGSGSPTNRFWPTLGNHDWHTITCDANGCNGAYFDYFTLPGNERYYEVDYGLVHLFAIDSDSAEPDGETPDSIQAIWLRDRLMASSSCFKVVFFHHAPYSSGRHGSDTDLQWPFGEWGADVVMAGHDHLYERLEKNTVPYIVNGSGGSTLYDFENAGNLPADVTSIVRYNDNYGAMLISADGSGMRLQFFNIDNELIDDHLVARQCNIEPTATNTPTNTATNTPTATPSDTPTTTPTETPTRTPTSTSTPSPTFSPTPSATTTNTPVVTLSDTPVSAATSTPTTSSLDSSVSYLPIVTADESALMTATEPGVAELFRIPPDNIVANLIERLASWLSGLYIRVTQS